MIVRFQVDACLPLRSARLHRKSDRSGNNTQRTRPITLNTPTTNKPTLQFPSVAVIRAGSHVPQSHLIELKTYSKAAGKTWSSSYPQLFLSQTPHIYYGAHKDGKFSEIKKFTLGEPHLETIDQNAQVGFKKLKVLLMAIQEIVRKYGTGGRISLVYDGKELGVYRRKKSDNCLPKYALDLFRSTG